MSNWTITIAGQCDETTFSVTHTDPEMDLSYLLPHALRGVDMYLRGSVMELLAKIVRETAESKEDVGLAEKFVDAAIEYLEELGKARRHREEEP